MARSSTKSYEIDMLNGAIFPKLLRFAVPLTLSTMLQLLFNAADVVVVVVTPVTTHWRQWAPTRL